MNLIFLNNQNELKAKVLIYAEQRDKGARLKCRVFDGNGELVGLCGGGDLLTFLGGLPEFLSDYIDPKWKAVPL